jgi:hypothetical protein
MASTCPHCQQADAFFRELQTKKPWLDIHRYEINQDKAALESFRQALKQQKLDDFSVPSIFFCDSRWAGFDTPATTGNVLSKSLDYCYEQISKKGELNKDTVTILRQWANATFFASGMFSKLNAMVVIPMMALVDALNSCSIFCVLALFAFLWLYRQKAVMVGLGLVFILAIIAVHYFQQYHSVFFYHALQGMRIPVALAGAGLIAYVFKIYSKKPKAHPGIVILGLVGLTALFIESYQQACLPNFALVFSQWLDFQPISALRRDVYIILYDLFYILPLILFMAAIIYCRVYRKVEQYKLFLVCTAWCILLLIGILFVFYPQGLANYPLSLLTLVLSLIAAWLTVRKSHGLKHHH